jgi:hypothetical protein
VRALMSDVNVQGQMQVLLRVLESDDWRELWEGLHLSLLTFRDLGLSPEASDATVWQLCQQEQVVLVTANRNDDGPESLEATLRFQNTPTSLPVLTIANSRQVLQSREYAERVAVRLIDYLLNIDNLRGTGRLHLP